MIEYSSTLFCSLEANVTGIKFYEGLVYLQSLCRVEFVIRVLPEKLGRVGRGVGAATIIPPPPKRL